MPNDVKAIVSLVTLLAAAAIAWWEYDNARTDLAWVVVGTGIFMVISMWIFPEAGVKKGQRSKGR
jgi:hypothetical protein